MKRVWVFLVLALSILASAILLGQPALAPGGEVSNNRPVRIGKQPFFLEVADSASEREKGLSGRTSVDAHEGMLFIFDEPAKQCFWMKDTLTSLDMLWFNSDYKLIHIQENVMPVSYPQNFCPDQDAQYVVELRSGAAAEFELKIGDVLTLQ